MNNTVSIEDFKREAKRRERNQKIKSSAKAAVQFIDDYKEEIAVVVPVLLGGKKVLGRILDRRTTDRKIKEERRHRDLEIYDHSTGMYLQLKRQMRPEEVVVYTLRVKNGEPKAVILRDMNLLK